MRAHFEFGVFTEVRTIHDTLAILERIEGEAKAVLVDTLHWSRSGGTAEDLAATARKSLSHG